MTVFSDLDVKQALVDGHVVCRPLRPENIKGSSVDLTLGEYFWRCDAKPHGVFNPYDEREVKRYFAGPFRARPYARVYEKIGRDLMNHWPPPAGDSQYMGTRNYSMPHPFVGIPEDWPVIVLRPRERLLGHSHEFVGVYKPGTTMLKARSSSGRVGIKVCDDAGWGDPGFVNRWTWEMRNDNDEAIVIPVGERMAQIVFFQTGEVGDSYRGKYQSDAEISELIDTWSPNDMLPRNWKDERQPPLPLDEESYAAAVEGLLAPF
jgi:deoxycytidine triphosphate deaminase